MDKTEARIHLVKQMSDEFRTTLDAYSAITRLQMLLDDVRLLKENFDKSPPETPYPKWRSFGIEVVSYYSVGFVTCLEWHARARLADLLSFRPSAIEEEDLKKDVGVKMLCRLIAQNVSIPYFVAMTRNISHADAYFSVFNRIFNALELKPAPQAVVRQIKCTGGDALAALEELFEYRNTLVHEINNTHVGHPFFHDHLDCDAALGFGQLALNAVRAIEDVISVGAPTGFPRKLTADGRPADVDAEMMSAIAEIEAKLEKCLGGSHGFAEALRLSRTALTAEEEMIFHASELHNRWLDLKSPVRRALLRARLSYLTELGAALELLVARAEMTRYTNQKI